MLATECSRPTVTKAVMGIHSPISLPCVRGDATGWSAGPRGVGRSVFTGKRGGPTPGAEGHVMHPGLSDPCVYATAFAAGAWHFMGDAGFMARPLPLPVPLTQNVCVHVLPLMFPASGPDGPPTPHAPAASALTWPSTPPGTPASCTTPNARTPGRGGERGRGAVAKRGGQCLTLAVALAHTQLGNLFHSSASAERCISAPHRKGCAAGPCALGAVPNTCAQP